MSVDVNNQSPSKISSSDVRTGVVICGCGGKISSILDTEFLQDKVADLPGICFSTSESYPCSKDGLERIRTATKEHQLERLLIAGCTPRLVEKLFQEAVESQGMAGSYVKVVDIREHCAFIHPDDPNAATQKALDLIRIGAARLMSTAPPTSYHIDVVNAALVIGSDLGGLTAALGIAEEGVEVTLVEEGDSLGQGITLFDDPSQKVLKEYSDSVTNHPNISIFLNSRVRQIKRKPGRYETTISHNGQSSVVSSGAMIIATGSREGGLDIGKWIDRSRVLTQSEFWTEIVSLNGGSFPFNDLVMLLHPENIVSKGQLRFMWKSGLRQVTQIKEQHPDVNVTLLFQDLPNGGKGTLDEYGLQNATKLGVTFFRYHRDHSPIIEDKTVNVSDPSTGRVVRIPFDRVVMATPFLPGTNTDRVASMLDLPQDQNGFIIDERLRLRPELYNDKGVFVVGGAHHPIDVHDSLFQGYLISSRVLQFLNQKRIEINRPLAEIDPSLCTGCGNCVQACPTHAIQLEKVDGLLSLAEVDGFRCTGCGNCVVVCPVKAIDLPGWEDGNILAQIDAALQSGSLSDVPTRSKPIIAFTCEWSATSAADMAGVQKLPYPLPVRIIPLNCSTRLDPIHILWAFLNGAEGVFVGACHRGECHYGKGSINAKARVETVKNQLIEAGIDPNRLQFEFLSGDDGDEFVNAITEFSSKVYSHQTPHSDKLMRGQVDGGSL